jgi:acyl-CoA hydrolase
VVIAEVNPQMPRTFGAAAVHVSQIDHLVPVDHPLRELPPDPPDPVRHRIAGRVAELIGDGDVLQTGIGAIPDAVLARLSDRKDLGIHTELFSDGLMRLVDAGVATGARKLRWPGKAVTSFVLGSRALYRWCDDNAALEMQPSDVTNDPGVIASEPNVVAINSALSVDLTGQVNSDSIGHRFYSGIGGQVDFMRGAARSAGGRAILALPSTARGGTVSRIVGTLAPGAGVVTSRGDVHHVVTEWGRTNLHGLSVRSRALALIGIAHPRFRDALTAEARALGLLA